jgi:NADH-quinone oxidoreductase subunit L
MPDFGTHPGYWFVLATALPLASFVVILVASGLWAVLRRYRETPGIEAAYQLLGGDRPARWPAYVALGAIALAFVCSSIGFVKFLIDEHQELNGPRHSFEMAIAHDKNALQHARGLDKTFLQERLERNEEGLVELEKYWMRFRDRAWRGTLLELVRVWPDSRNVKDSGRGTVLAIGYSIDSLAALMFLMVTFVASLIHLFSIGYMKEEEEPEVTDHQVHTEHGHLHRRGRFGRFFMFLSLFCFSMLNLVLASNLFQVFISWELVGICSYLLIGFYFERRSASNAANKAFITNRIGDAGFILGLLIVFAYIGTFDFEDMFRRVRSPLRDTHGQLKLAGQVVRADVDLKAEPSKEGREMRITLPGAATQGSEAVLFPKDQRGHFHGLGERGNNHGHDKAEHDEPELTFTAVNDPGAQDYSSMPYWLLVAAGLGIFLGCVGKSAQFPLQVWLPDAMEGPTPVSALIHAATMVAAGVYLVGRVYPLFTVEVLLVIAYVGAITLFVAATIAIVMTDIKKVLAYSTVSQLGYMMLALGVGGWVAGLFHLFTHAFFKALLFLCSGSVIYGCHHEQEMTKMGGLYPKMKITALTMLVGCLAIAGMPLFSGWHSKDAVVAQCLGYVSVNPNHALLFVLPLATAGVTTFYMFRMWFMTFTGQPRDHHVYEHAHESPWQMTVPLVGLAFFAVVVSWGNRPWIASESHLESTIHHSMPASVMAEFGHVREEETSGAAGKAHGENWPEVAAKPAARSERHRAHQLHDQAGMLAMGISLLGFVFAFAIYYRRALDPAEAKEQFPRVYDLLANKWYFDAVYSVLLVRPAVIVAQACRWFDLTVIDGIIHGLARCAVRVSKIDGWIDNNIVDGLVNLVGNTTFNLGTSMRNVQTGYLRSYVLFLVLAAVAIFALLSYFVTLATAG